MSKLGLEFRAKLKTLALAGGWKVIRNSFDRFELERRPTTEVLQQVLLNPQTSYQSEERPKVPCVSCWAFVEFEPIERRISELIGSAGHDIHITDRRTASFSLSSVLKDGDPKCIQGYPLEVDLPMPEQALDFWSFLSTRMVPALAPLTSLDCLASESYVPPFTSPVSWGTRRILWHGLAGRFETATKLAEHIESIAPADLTSSARKLQSLAAERGHTFLPTPGALQYSTHPRWLEFLAVRDHVARIA